jgi:hypothetical protein
LTAKLAQERPPAISAISPHFTSFAVKPSLSQGLLILGSEESDPRNNTKEHETSDAEFVLFRAISWTAVLSLWQN